MNRDGYPTDRDAKRAAVFARDDHRCHSCGLTEGSESKLDVHHVIPIEDGGTHEMANLSTICSDCLDILHGHEVQQALGSDSDSRSINSYADLYQTFQETYSLILHESDVHLAGFTPENDLGSVVSVYEGDRGETVDGLRKSKSKLGNVDPYDLENMHLPEAEVEDLSDEILRKCIKLLNLTIKPTDSSKNTY